MQKIFLLSGQSDETLAIVVENAISSGKGKMIIDGNFKATSNAGLREKNILESTYKKFLSIVIELLVTNQVKTFNADGMTPLMLSVKSSYDLFKMVLDSSPLLNEQDNQDQTALMLAATLGDALKK